LTNFWDNRYSAEEYAYGTKPNAFFADELRKIKPGKILLPAEGEGRNALFAAINGWEVTAFDNSKIAKEKALKLIRKYNVDIDYHIADYFTFPSKIDNFDAVSLIYAHINSSMRKSAHKRLITFIKPGGKILIEGFSRHQLNFNSGGPKDPTLLYSSEDLLDDFNELSEVEIFETETELNEGLYHRGIASIIRLIGIK
jgi:SAM-dependent methyltransferase